jgi:hypothetical protein
MNGPEQLVGQRRQRVRAHGGAAGELPGASPLGAPGLSGLGFLAQNEAKGKGILTRGSLTSGWVPRWLAAIGTLLHSFSSVHGTSKSSPVLKLGVEQRRLLLKLIGWFNHRGNRWKITSHGVLGFWFWRLEIGAIGAPFYRGFVLMSYPRRTPCCFISKLTSNRKESQQIKKGKILRWNNVVQFNPGRVNLIPGHRVELGPDRVELGPGRIRSNQIRSGWVRSGLGWVSWVK